MSQEQVDEVRYYGGWRRQRGVGLWGLGIAGTLTVLAVVVLVILLAALDVRALALAGPVVVVAGGLGLVRVGGESLTARAVRWLRWRYALSRGFVRYEAVRASALPGGLVLPGVLAPMALLAADDGHGGRCGMVWDRRAGLLTVTLRVAPASTWLAERAEADQWVASWGGWLASLGQVPMLRWVTVTVDTAPKAEATLADAAAVIDPAAPAAARSILALLVAAAPVAAARVDTRVSLTFDPRAAPAAPGTLADAMAEVSRVLPGLELALGGCGVSVLGWLSEAEIATVVRAAFRPAARGETAPAAGLSRGRTVPPREVIAGPIGRVEAAWDQVGCGSADRGDITQVAVAGGAGRGLGARGAKSRAAAERAGGWPASGWAGAGPRSAEEFPGYYRHDGAVSVSWGWVEAPRQNVTCDVLARLVMPGRYAKRVSVQYRPFPAASAARVLEAEVNAASFRAHYRHRTGRDETARDTFDQARARQAAVEEAAGAGVCLLSMIVTVTVSNISELPQAVAWTEAAAEASKIRLRRMTCSQAAGFAATLPCGICPAEMARRMPR